LDVFDTFGRGEFVSAWANPLSPDAFSGFVARDSDHEKHADECISATKALHASLHEFAQEWVVEPPRWQDIRETDLHTRLHSRGINCRYLGKVLASLPAESDPRFSLACVCELICRVLKGLFRERLRAKARTLKLVVQGPYRQLAVDFLNLTFGCFRVGDLPDTTTLSRSREFWHQKVLPGLDRFHADGLRDTLSEVEDVRHYLFEHPFQEFAKNGDQATLECLRPENVLRFVLNHFCEMTGLTVQGPKTKYLDENPGFLFAQGEFLCLSIQIWPAADEERVLRGTLYRCRYP
jgi:Translation initiation factor eIF3 subunit 135